MEQAGKVDYAARRQALRRQMAKAGLDGVVIAPGANLYYLAGYWGHLSRRFTALVLGARDGQEVFVCPDFELSLHSASAQDVADFRTWPRRNDPEGPAAQAFADWGVRTGTIGLDPVLPWLQAGPLLGAMGGAKFVSAADVMASVRMIKAADEIELMKQATQAANLAIRAAVAELKPGVEESHIGRLFMTGTTDRDPAAESWILPLFGPASAEPHGLPDSRSLTPGSVVLLDYGTSFRKYRSDTTRTVFFGPVEDEARRVWDVVYRSYQAAVQGMRPGMTLTEVDSLARKVIDDAGYGPLFNHGLGHGIGLEVHERPYPEPRGDAPLLPGTTFTIEPGIYLKGRFGVRIENVVVVTESGCEPILDDPAIQTTWPG